MVSLRLRVLSQFSSLSRSERSGSFVARIEPPPMPNKRPPVTLVLALDVSSSMGGDKLVHAIAAARAVTAALSAADTFACVTFANRARVLLPPTRMDAHGKHLASARLGQAQAEGNTNLGAAIHESLGLLATTGGSVLLLTDGCPTEGVTNDAQLTRLAQGTLAGTQGSATLSTFGFGRDVNPTLLHDLADAGKGRYTFLEGNEPPVRAIAAELGGLLSTVTSDVVLQLRPADGVRITRVHRGSGLSFTDTTAQVELSPLIADEPVSIAFELEWDERALGKPFGLVTLRTRSLEDGTPLAAETPIAVALGDGRGAVEAEAARQILLSRVAIALANASSARKLTAAEISLALARQHAEFCGEARALWLDGDPQVAGALAMMDEAVRGLLRATDRARQDLVASAASVRDRRSTSMGVMAPHAQRAFITNSQRQGMDLLGKPNPGPKS